MVHWRPLGAFLAALGLCLALAHSGRACFSLDRELEYEQPPISRKELLMIALLELQQREKDLGVLIQARKAVRYLVDNMPEPDLGKVPASTLARITLRRVKRRIEKWPEVPWEVFVEFTLPYAVLSEPRDSSLSEAFLDKLQRHVDQVVPPGASLREAASVLNRKAYAITSPPIEFKPAPPNKVNAYSPYEVVRDKAASCTGESVFLVYALREFGIPARVAGVPHWNRDETVCPDGDRSPACGNHNWVEAYTEKGWVFFDQNTDNPPNKAWFFPELTDAQIANDWYHSIYASTWRVGSKMHFPLVFDPTYLAVSAIERTLWYHSLHKNNINNIEATEDPSHWREIDESLVDADDDHLPNLQVA